MKTIVYVDGFNLYYRALKNTKYKWLDLEKLCKSVMPNHCDIAAINYYTARISSRVSKTSPKDQNTYLTALQTLPNLKIHLGKFQVKQKRMFLAQPVKFKPACSTYPQPNPEYVDVIKTEEKGSDVNLSVHLVRDAFIKAFDCAAVITDDTDLVEPIRIVAKEANIPITLMTPVKGKYVARGLKNIATSTRHISGHLGSCQFPEIIKASDGKTIIKPQDW